MALLANPFELSRGPYYRGHEEVLHSVWDALAKTSFQTVSRIESLQPSIRKACSHDFFRGLFSRVHGRIGVSKPQTRNENTQPHIYPLLTMFVAIFFYLPSLPTSNLKTLYSWIFYGPQTRGSFTNAGPYEP